MSYPFKITTVRQAAICNTPHCNLVLLTQFTITPKMISLLIPLYISRHPDGFLSRISFQLSSKSTTLRRPRWETCTSRNRMTFLWLYLKLHAYKLLILFKYALLYCKDWFFSILRYDDCAVSIMSPYVSSALSFHIWIQLYTFVAWQGEKTIS